jgi:hypothetical protein
MQPLSTQPCINWKLVCYARLVGLQCYVGDTIVNDIMHVQCPAVSRILRIERASQASAVGFSIFPKELLKV